MKSRISLNEFTENLELVRAYIANSPAKNFTCVEYRTFNEGMCEANFFVIPKSEVVDEFEAFIALCNYQIHFYEEWVLSGTTPEYIDSVLNRWMHPEVEGYLYKSLSSDEIHKEIDWIINEIRQLFPDDEFLKNCIDSDRWGVFVNKERISSKTTLSDLGLDKVTGGVGLNLEWNSVDIIYQTESDYVFFSWATGV